MLVDKSFSVALFQIYVEAHLIFSEVGRQARELSIYFLSFRHSIRQNVHAIFSKRWLKNFEGKSLGELMHGDYANFGLI
jgi:hypothetical protein